MKPKLDLTFARVLRSVLRQDPDTILIGEIRDQETAAIALRSALTGHLVLATLHTNNAASTAIRLIDMGAKGYLVAATIKAVLAQRLIRRVCESCAEPYTPSEKEKKFFTDFLGIIGEEKTFKKGKGCSYCNNTGYKGRVGIFELLEFNEEMIDALRRDDSNEFMKLSEKYQTSKTLVDNAFKVACEGTTTLEEVLRVAGG